MNNLERVIVENKAYYVADLTDWAFAQELYLVADIQGMKFAPVRVNLMQGGLTCHALGHNGNAQDDPCEHMQAVQAYWKRMEPPF